jgi:hypothetical protein
MKDPAEPAHPGTSSVPAALLDYFEAPGRYQLTLRQPAVLFASIREILQLASSRTAADAPQSSALRDAANFFIRAALLYPGADHYAVLGLAPGEAPADLKERYRLLMRLIHPDFAGSGSPAWPGDAAVRVNRAYEVLSSAVLRREYDEQLEALRTQRPAAPKGTPFAAAPVRRLEEPRARFSKKAAVVFGLAVGIPAVLLLMPRSEPDQLVQRLGPPAAEQRSRPADGDLHAQAPIATAPALPQAPPAPPPVASPQPPAVAPAPAPAAAVASPAKEPTVARLPPRDPPAAPSRPPAVKATVTAATTPAANTARPPAPAVASPPRPVQAVVAPRAASPSGNPSPPLPAPAPVLREEVAASPASAPVAAAAPALAAVSTSPAAAMPVATATPSAPVAAKLTTTLTLPAPATPTLAEVQPVLTQMLQMLETGSGDQLLRLLDSDSRKHPAAQALSRQYEQLVKGGRPIQLSQVEFNSEPREGGVLMVTGRIRLHAGEPTIGSFGQKLVVKAEFAQRSGRVQLTGLSSAPE